MFISFAYAMMHSDIKPPRRHREPPLGGAAINAGWYDILKVACVSALIVFGYPLTNFALHIDGELLLRLQNFNGDIALGRWGTALLHATILPQVFVPFFTPALSVLLWASSATVTSMALGLPPRLRPVFVALYVSFPAFAYQLEFPFQSDCVAFGVLCATLSWVCFAEAFTRRDRRIPATLAGLGLLTFGISFYQSILFVPSTIAIVFCLRETIHKAALRRLGLLLLGLLVFMAVAYTLCVIIGMTVQRITGIPHAVWMSGMVGWGHVPMTTALPAALSAFTRTVLGGEFYGNGIYATCWIAAGSIILRICMARACLARIMLVTALSALALSAPFAAIGLLGQNQPARTYLAQAISFAGIWAVALEQISWRTRLLQTAVAAGSLAYGCYHVSSLFVADTMSYQADCLLGSRIVSAIYRADPAFDERSVPVSFVGSYAPPNVWRQSDFDVFGASFFAWDGGNPDRMIYFLKAAGLADLHGPEKQEAAIARQEALLLELWPNPNSVRLIHGMVVVRLGS